MTIRREESNRTSAQVLLVCCAALGIVSTAMSAGIDPVGVFHGVMDFLDPHKFRKVGRVYPSTDGTIWVLGEDSWGEESGWYARRLSSTGERLGDDIRIGFDVPGLWYPGAVVPVGVLPQGDLVVDIDDGHIYEYMARISPDGTSEVTRVRKHCLGQPFVDRSGIAHIMIGVQPGAGYVQVNMAAPGLPVIREIDYSQPGSGFTPIPDHLLWQPGYNRTRHETAFFSEENGRMLVATLTRNSDSSSLGLYRIDTRTLNAEGAGRIDLTKDVYRRWIGPVIPKTRIVPASKDGYWLIAPTGGAPPEPTVVAYRIGHDLSIIRPSKVGTEPAGDFTDAPGDAVVMAKCPFTRPTKLASGEVQVKVELELTAFDQDGRLYARSFQDSLTSRFSN